MDVSNVGRDRGVPENIGQEGPVSENVARTAAEAALEVKQRYEELIRGLQRIFAKSVLTEDDFKEMDKIITALSQLGKEGIPSSDGETSHLTPSMHKALEAIRGTLQILGIEPGKRISHEMRSEINEILDIAVTVGDEKKLAEKLYEKYMLANAILNADLSVLEKALRTSAGIADILKEIFDLRINGTKPYEPPSLVEPKEGDYIDAKGNIDYIRYTVDHEQWQKYMESSFKRPPKPEYSPAPFNEPKPENPVMHHHWEAKKNQHELNEKNAYEAKVKEWEETVKDWEEKTKIPEKPTPPQESQKPGPYQEPKEPNPNDFYMTYGDDLLPKFNEGAYKAALRAYEQDKKQGFQTAKAEHAAKVNAWESKVNEYNTKVKEWEGKIKELEDKAALVNSSKPKPPTIVASHESAEALLTAREDLRKQMDELAKQGIVPDGSGNLADQLDKVIQDLDGVLEEFDNANFPSGDYSTWPPEEQKRYGELLGKAVYEYLLDGRDEISGGKYHDVLSKAITAFQTLNENQQDELKKKTFLFDQLKNLPDLLNRLSEILVSIARGIAKA